MLIESLVQLIIIVFILKNSLVIINDTLNC